MGAETHFSRKVAKAAKVLIAVPHDVLKNEPLLKAMTNVMHPCLLGVLGVFA